MRSMHHIYSKCKNQLLFDFSGPQLHLINEMFICWLYLTLETWQNRKYFRFYLLNILSIISSLIFSLPVSCYLYSILLYLSQVWNLITLKIKKVSDLSQSLTCTAGVEYTTESLKLETRSRFRQKGWWVQDMLQSVKLRWRSSK